MTSEVIAPPTCTGDGLTRHYCTRRGCKYEYTTNAPGKLGHVTGSPKVYQPVTLNCATNGKTCTASRKWTQPCTRCGTNLNSGTDTATATVTSAVKTAATCTTKGTTTYTHKFSESWAPAQHTKDVQDIPKDASSHTQSKIKATTSTNPARGANVCWIYPCCHTVADSTHTSVNGGTANAHTVCSDCGYVISTTHTAINGGTADVHTKCSCGYVISSTHTYDKSVATSTYLKSTANCLSPAVYYKSCSCGYSNKSTTFTSGSKNPNNHASTCTIVYGGTSGVHQKYSGCGATYSTTHTYNQSIATSTYLKSGATCTSPAVYYKSCLCGYSNKSATFTSGSKNPNNHTGSSVNGGTSGVHTKYSCCGVTISSNHSYTSTTTPANCQNYSSTKYICSCGYNYTTTGNTYGDHVWEQGAAGSTGYCTICGYTCYHDNAEYVSYQNGWHDVTCPDCSYSAYVQCTSNFSCDGYEWNSYSTTQHIWECEYCDYQIIENCTDYSSGECSKCGNDCRHKSGYYYGDQYPDYESAQWGCSYAEHEYYCSVCNKYLGRQSCWIWGNMIDNGDGTHTCTCSECGNSYTEDHYDECDGWCACGYEIGGGDYACNHIGYEYTVELTCGGHYKGCSNCWAEWYCGDCWEYQDCIGVNYVWITECLNCGEYTLWG